MKITEEVREYAQKQAANLEGEAFERGLQEKAEEFKKSGFELYRQVDPTTRLISLTDQKPFDLSVRKEIR